MFRWCSLVLILFGAGCTNTLNRAIYREKPAAIDEFLAKGTNVNQADEDGGTPLIYAAQYAGLDLMQKLVARGAAVDAVDHQGNSALSYLAGSGTYRNDAVEFLIAHGADVNHPNKQGETPLHLAAKRLCEPGDVERQTRLFTVLLDAGANPDLLNSAGELPLHLAAFAGQPVAALAKLLEATKDPQCVSHAGYHALSAAARGDRREAAAYLASRGFEPQKLVPAPSASDSTPLAGVTASPPVFDLSWPIDARSHEAYADYLLDQGKLTDALENYRSSQASFDAAVAQYQHAVDQSSVALKQAKDGRTSRLVKTIAANVVGGGLAVATGVGFFAVPKKVDNHIDEYADELERDQAELTTLKKEQAELVEKLRNATGPREATTDQRKLEATVAGRP